MLTGFSPRKQDLTLYIGGGLERYSALLKKLGKHRGSKACLYIKTVDDIDMQVLKEIIAKSFAHMVKTNPSS